MFTFCWLRTQVGLRVIAFHQIKTALICVRFQNESHKNLIASQKYFLKFRTRWFIPGKKLSKIFIWNRQFTYFIFVWLILVLFNLLALMKMRWSKQNSKKHVCLKFPKQLQQLFPWASGAVCEEPILVSSLVGQHISINILSAKLWCI